MKRSFLKKTAAALSLLTVLGLFTACGEEEVVPEVVEPEVLMPAVTIEADGKQITIEDTEGKTVAQLVEQAQITMNEGDLLSVDADQAITENITVKVLRKVMVTVNLKAKKSKDNKSVTLVLYGGTVADAIAAAGFELTEDQIVNLEQDKELEDGMEIEISFKEEEKKEETKTTTSKKNNNKKPSNKKPSSSGSSSSGGSSSGGSSSGGSSSGGKTVVSVKIYEDCDGSGHGVKVITYSDGTQKEVPF